MTTHASLVAAVTARIGQLAEDNDRESEEAFSTDTPPLAESDIATIETRFGHGLPLSVTELYVGIGDGGYGPSYGLLRLEDAVETYNEFRAPDPQDPHWRWQEGLLPLIKLGCGMYFCVDCFIDEARVVWFEPNPHVAGASWADAFFLGPSFEKLMRDWAEGADTLQLMEAFGQGHD